MVAVQGQVPETHSRIIGNVGDPVGAFIPRASVVLRTPNNTKTTATINTDEQGNYTLRDVASGTYELIFDAQGFKPFVHRQVTVWAGEETVVPQARLSIDLSAAICILIITAEAPSKSSKKSSK